MRVMRVKVWRRFISRVALNIALGQRHVGHERNEHDKCDRADGPVSEAEAGLCGGL